MTYYLYKKPDGQPDVSEQALALELFPGWVLVAQSQSPFNIYDKVFDADNNLVDRQKDYDELRRLAYPPLGDQIDALWHAMDDGLIPKIEPMYSAIKAVKDAYPKPSN